MRSQTGAVLTSKGVGGWVGDGVGGSRGRQDTHRREMNKGEPFCLEYVGFLIYLF